VTEPQLVERECGDCRVCCTIFEIPELEKPKRQLCVHLCKKGCEIYPERPSTCRAYRCRWLQGDPQLERRDRPDRLGVVFDTQGDANPLLQGIKHVIAREVLPSAFKRKRAERWIATLQAERLLIQISYSGQQRVLGPASLVEELERRTKATGQELPIAGKTPS
jgi:hypothetical protein